MNDLLLELFRLSCTLSGVSLERGLSQDKSNPCRIARHAFYAAVTSVFKNTPQRIKPSTTVLGKITNRNHVTVLYAIKMHEVNVRDASIYASVCAGLLDSATMNVIKQVISLYESGEVLPDGMPLSHYAELKSQRLAVKRTFEYLYKEASSNEHLAGYQRKKMMEILNKAARL